MCSLPPVDTSTTGGRSIRRERVHYIKFSSLHKLCRETGTRYGVFGEQFSVQHQHFLQEIAVLLPHIRKIVGKLTLRTVQRVPVLQVGTFYVLRKTFGNVLVFSSRLC